MSKLETLNKCLICSSKKISKYTKTKSYYTEGTKLINDFEISKCDKCGFVFTNPRPTIEYISKYYTDDSAYYKNTIKINPKDVMDKNNKKVLDIGFGNCNALLNKYKEGWECYGIDLSKYAVKKAKKMYPMLNLQHGTLKDIKFKKNTFDFIIMSHVLEHDHDPIKLLKEVKRVLKPCGTLQIDIPNFGGLYYSVLKEKAEFWVPHHLSFFDRSTLSLALKKAGFKKYKILNIFGNNMSFHILNKLGIQKTYYKKTIFNKFLGLIMWPIEIFFKKGDALRAFATK